MTSYKHVNFIPFIQEMDVKYFTNSNTWTQTYLVSCFPCFFTVSCSPLPALTAQMDSVPQAWLLLWDLPGQARLTAVQWASAEHSPQAGEGLWSF